MKVGRKAHVGIRYLSSAPFGSVALVCKLLRGVTVLTCIICLFGSLPASEAPMAPAPRPVTKSAAIKTDRLSDLLAKLNSPVEAPVPAKEITVGEYVVALSKAHGVRIDFSHEAFTRFGYPHASEHKLWRDFPRGVRLVTLLRAVSGAAQDIRIYDDNDNEVVGRGGLLVRDGYIELVPTELEVAEFRLRARVVGDPERRYFFPGVSIVVRDRPLADVLHELSESNNVNVVVSAKAAKTAGTKITTRLLNVPIDTAISTLAQQAELDVVISENIFLVTTPDHAEKLKRANDWAEDQLDARRRERDNWGDGFNFRHAVLDPTNKVTLDLVHRRIKDVVDRLKLDGFNVTLDPAVGKKAEFEVSAKLVNISCEAGVKQLAELAGLRAVRMDNSLFVTTPEKADRLAPAKPLRSRKGKAP